MSDADRAKPAEARPRGWRGSWIVCRLVRKPVLASLLVLVAVLCLPRLAAAQPGAAPEASRPAPPAPSTFGPPSQGRVEPPRPEAPDPEAGQPLSEATALGLSAAGTVLSWALFVGGAGGESGTLLALGALGTFLGPNMGHWYRGAVVTRGTGLRAVAVLAASYGFVRSAFCEDSCRERDKYIFLGGLLLYVGATIDDIVMAPLRVREHNRELQLGLAPMVTPHGAGLAIGGRF
jgi:hypothetical protein